jgi:hypothetical protein
MLTNVSRASEAPPEIPPQEHTLNLSRDSSIPGSRATTSKATIAHTSTLSTLESVKEKCGVCSKRLPKRAGDFRRHMKKHNPKIFKYPCTMDGCQKTFYRADKLKNHLDQKHKPRPA